MAVLPSYRTQWIVLLCKSVDWFLYEGYMRATLAINGLIINCMQCKYTSMHVQNVQHIKRVYQYDQEYQHSWYDCKWDIWLTH